MDDSSYVLMLYSKYAEQCYSEFLVSGKSFIDASRKVMEKVTTQSDVKTFLNDIMNVTVSGLLKMAFVYQSEMFKNKFLNEALPDEKNLLKDVKDKICKQNKNINNAQIYKLIRDAIVHSDPAHPNCQVTGINELTLKLKPKGQPEIDIKLSNSDMMKIITVFNLNIENAMYYVEIKEQDLQNAIENGVINQANVSDFVSLKQYGERIEFDEYQRDALVNYFYSNNDVLKHRYNFGSWAGELLMSRIPLQSNPYNLYTDYMKVVYYFMELSRNVNLNINEMEKLFYKNNVSNNVPYREFITINPLIDIGYNIILASFSNLATSVTKSDFVEMCVNGGVSIDEEVANHLRNSMAHGRYFINPKNPAVIEFYDGRDLNNLSHIQSLTIKQIDNIMNKQIFKYDATLGQPGE